MTFFNSEAIAHRKFEKLAKEYYEEYYYGRFIETIDESVFDTKMKTFEETGLQPVTLRQLLLYNSISKMILNFNRHYIVFCTY